MRGYRKWVACCEWLEDPANDGHPRFAARCEEVDSMVREWSAQAEEYQSLTGASGTQVALLLQVCEIFEGEVVL